MVLRKEVIAPMIRATAIHSWNVFENSDHVLATQPRLELIQKIFNTCKLVDNLEAFYVPLFTDFLPDTPSPFGSGGSSTKNPRTRSPHSPRKKSKDKKENKLFRSAEVDDAVSESESKKERVCICICTLLFF